MTPIRRSSLGDPLCQSCSDVIEQRDRRRRTDAGVMHWDCADDHEREQVAA